MSGPSLQRVREIYDAALDAAPQDLGAWLAEHHAAEPEAAAEVLRLLAQTTASWLVPPPARLWDAVAEAPSDRPAPALHLGAVVAGRYELQEVLGTGASGVVYGARDVVTPRPLAVKVFAPGALGGRADPRAEAALLRLLRLPGIVRLYEDGVDAVGPYLVMERVHGAPFPGRPGPLTWTELAPVALGLLEAVDRVHWAGIVHRDLKPSNVLVTSEGRPVVLDLGISRAARAAAEGVRLGTPRYMAPEAWADGTFDRRSDLFALGVLLADALGHPTAPGGSDAAWEAVPARVRDVVAALRHDDPRLRPASASEALVGLSGGHARVRDHRAFLEAHGDAPGPLDPAHVAALFHGHERVHHIPSDAAAVLQDHAGPTARDLLDHLDTWERAGFGRWEGERFTIDRAGIERARRLGRPLRRSAPGPLDADLDDLALRALVALNLSPAPLPLHDLASVLGAEEATTAACLQALEDAGRVQRSPAAATWRGVGLPDVALPRLERDGAALRARLAGLRPLGDAERIGLLVGAGRLEGLAEEALAVAERALDAGDRATATWAIEEGLGAAQDPADDATRCDLLEALLLATLQEPSNDGLQTLLHHIGRSPPTPRVRRLEVIARGFRASAAGEGPRALESLPAVAAGVTHGERRALASIRLFAVRQGDPETAEREIVAVEAAARDSAGSLQGYVLSARAWQAYEARRYREAAYYNLRSMRHSMRRAPRIAALINASSALIDDGDLVRAQRLAQQALDAAATLRNASIEVRAQAHLRGIAYRRALPLLPDTELVSAAQALGTRSSVAGVALVEAAFAWRAGLDAEALRLARICQEHGDAGRISPRGLVARALVALLDPDPTPEALAQLARDIAEHASAEAVFQAAGLLARRPGPHVAAMRVLARQRAEEVGGSTEARHEVLSISEAVQ